MRITKAKTKQCENNCPKCNTEMQNIDYNDIEITAAGVYQNAICQKCGCRFVECYKYCGTEFEDK